ncbi:hypothetical protein AE618_00110 [Bosea vaviloviae]|uniref:Addiction module toxin RelE n=1 Tax=Bosea vaviloviae TaxID=1526658 RepID=A0A0N0ME13_9HYPH|nr:hypothetical protein AE618_00110 [Bosea vaviloviae]
MHSRAYASHGVGRPIRRRVERWFLNLESSIRVEIAAKISLLQQVGPTLGRPHADTLKGSAYPNMKELRVQIGGDPWRIFFAFDPRRSAILLVDGNKGGDGRFHEVNLPIADERYRDHLATLIVPPPSKRGPK